MAERRRLSRATITDLVCLLLIVAGIVAYCLWHSATIDANWERCTESTPTPEDCPNYP